MEENTPQTVQYVSDKLFEHFSQYSFGDSFHTRVNGFPYLALIQPIRIVSQDLAIGLHREERISHFFLFNKADAYKEKTNKNHRICTVFVGKIEGSLPDKQFFKNRIYYDIVGKINDQQNYLHVISLILSILDTFVRNTEIQGFTQGLSLSAVPLLEIISETKKTILKA